MRLMTSFGGIDFAGEHLPALLRRVKNCGLPTSFPQEPYFCGGVALAR